MKDVIRNTGYRKCIDTDTTLNRTGYSSGLSRLFHISHCVEITLNWCGNLAGTKRHLQLSTDLAWI